jgi:hypothetical protein
MPLQERQTDSARTADDFRIIRRIVVGRGGKNGMQRDLLMMRSAPPKWRQVSSSLVDIVERFDRILEPCSWDGADAAIALAATRSQVPLRSYRWVARPGWWAGRTRGAFPFSQRVVVPQPSMY